ncbi:MAG: type II toxin-antitoxin system HicA family toxin [Methanoregula sp.]|nr:type II toxin-antitoxin system HicA family toxin [Methanoregula sp.]
MPHHKPVSGDLTIKILCNRFGFSISRRTGSHVCLVKITPEGKIGTVVPDHDELKPGTLKGVLKLAKVDIDDFYRFV